MTKPPKRPRDPNQLAKFVIDVATGDVTPDDAKPTAEARAVAGHKGGVARAESLSPERRKEVAAGAAAKRWKKGQAVS